MVKLPVVENDPPHSISIVSGSVMSGFTCRRLRSEIACDRLAAMRGAADIGITNRAATVRKRMPARLVISLIENHGANALNLINRYRALDPRGIELAVLVRGLFLGAFRGLLLSQLQLVQRAFRNCRLAGG